MKSNQPTNKIKVRRSLSAYIITIFLCVAMMATCPRASAPLSELEVAVGTCVITIAVISGLAMLYRECKPKASLYWYWSDHGNGPKVYVCLDINPTTVSATHHFCQGPFGTMSYCQERAFEANTTWHGEDHCGPRASSPIRKKVSFKKSTDGGKTFTEFTSKIVGVDDNTGFVVKFPGTTFSTNAFDGLSLLEADILANPTNHIEVSDSSALFVMSSVIVDDSTNAPMPAKTYDANRMMKDGLLNP